MYYFLTCATFFWESMGENEEEAWKLRAMVEMISNDSHTDYVKYAGREH